MDYKDIVREGLSAEELRELSMEELGGVTGGKHKSGGAWNRVHEYIDEMNRKYRGADTTMDDLSPEERRHLQKLRDAGYEEWRNRY